MRQYACSLQPGSARLGAPGFTLIEMVIVIVVMSIVATMVGTFMASAIHAYTGGRDANEVMGRGQFALERMKRELRELRSPADVTTWTATQFSFVDIYGQNIDYSFSGAQLLRNGQVMVDGITASGFSYLQADGQTLPAASTDIRIIGFSFSVAVGDYQQHAAATVLARNL